MGSTATATAFLFEVGEDVVVRLRGVEVVELDTARILHIGLLRRWTIGEIVETTSSDGALCYAIRFAYRGSACVCVVAEAAIDGTA
jgi:hypothetical protein